MISHKDGSIGVPLEDFVLSISHSKTMKISTVKPEKNMLSGPGPMSPPWGVPIIFLDDIKLIFRISNSWNMRQLDTTSTDRLYLDMLLAAIEHLEPAFKNQGMLLDDPLLFSKSAWIQLDLNDTASAKSSFNPKTGFIASFPTGFPLAVPQINIFAQKVDCDFPVMRPQIECAMQSSAREKEFVIDLVKLVDAGFRTILTKDKPQLHSGLSMAISCDGPKLLEIAPAVFNPDYLRVSPLICINY